MKWHAPATQRNREPIAQVLAQELPARGTLLEVAAGSGEHAVFFAGLFPGLIWQPTDPDPDALSSITAWRDEDGPANLAIPLLLDASSDDWPISAADAMLCVNMTHISPWAATEGLFAGAGRLLPAGAPLLLYGPFIEAGVETAQSNLAFDESLRARNPAWGLRDLAAIDGVAGEAGLARTRLVRMPANNLTLVYRRG